MQATAFNGTAVTDVSFPVPVAKTRRLNVRLVVTTLGLSLVNHRWALQRGAQLRWPSTHST
jgi:hypothetical protein